MSVSSHPFRDNGLLPEGVEVVSSGGDGGGGGGLAVRGPVGLRHAGMYRCWLSYRHFGAELELNVTVKPRAEQLGQRTARTISGISLR